MNWLSDFLRWRCEKRTKFPQNLEDGTWPPAAVIMPGGLRNLRGTHSDPPLAVRPWVDSAGVPHLFGRSDGEQ